MNIAEYNRGAWDALVERGNEWTVPVPPEVIAAARKGDWQILLTPRRPVPREWFPPLAGLPVLCLAGAGGQQGPVLAAAGADVTVLDNSPRQLGQDRLVAERDGLRLRTVPGDMRDLRPFADGEFGLVVHPCSNCFVPDVRPVWREAFRVLRPGGVLLAGFFNPAVFVFDGLGEKAPLAVRFRLPYSDLESLPTQERERLIREGEPLLFGHTLEAQLGGQVEAGFALTGLYEDTWPGKAVSEFMPAFLATRAVKPPGGGAGGGTSGKPAVDDR